MALTSTQIGTIGENLLVNGVMTASDGRLSPFRPVADDDGIDVLFFDKFTGQSVAIQLKCRTTTLLRTGTDIRGNTVHFEVRKSTFSDARRAWLVAALLDQDLTRLRAAWLIPLADLPSIARGTPTKWVIRPSIAPASNDRYAPFRCLTQADLAARIAIACAAIASPDTPAA